MDALISKAFRRLSVSAPSAGPDRTEIRPDRTYPASVIARSERGLSPPRRIAPNTEYKIAPLHGRTQSARQDGCSTRPLGVHHKARKSPL